MEVSKLLLLDPVWEDFTDNHGVVHAGAIKLGKAELVMLGAGSGSSKRELLLPSTPVLAALPTALPTALHDLFRCCLR